MSLVPVDHPSFAPVPAPTAQPDWIALMQPAADLASQIAGTDFVPEAYRRNPAAIAACILFGAEIGIGPMQSLAKIDIVKGRPAPRAELARAKALAAGHDLWVTESTNTRVTVQGKRRGTNHTHTVTWTMDDAKKAGIAGNPNYAKYPRQMLLARASAELVRQMCPEVLGGITVFAEEAADIDTTDAPTVTASAPDSPAGTRKRSRPVKATSVPHDTTEPTTTPDPAGSDKPTSAQTKMAMATFKEIGIDEKDDRLAATSALIGHPCESWSDLTRSEASTVIDGLQKIRDGGLAFEITEDGVWVTVAARDDLLDDDDNGEDEGDGEAAELDLDNAQS